MKNSIILSLLAIAVSVVIGACEPTSSERDGIESKANETLSQTVDDVWLHGKILAKLVGSAKTPARNIDIGVNEGVVTLRGVVSDPKEKTEVENVVKEIEGVKAVENQIKVNS